MENDKLTTNDVESALDEADRQAATTQLRYSHSEVFESLREGLCERWRSGTI